MACSLLESDLERAQPQINQAVIFIPKERDNQLAGLSYIVKPKKGAGYDQKKIQIWSTSDLTNKICWWSIYVLHWKDEK